MARQTSAVELSNFVAGLITEASPLTFPNNASLDEKNFVLLRDGSRKRRLGVDLEANFVEVTTSIVVPPTGEIAFKSYQWNNAGGDPRRNLIVVQVGNELRIFDPNISPISSALLYTRVFDDVDITKLFSFTTVDGLLILANGGQELLSLEFKNGAITVSSFRLLIRDLFGVSDSVAGVNLRQGSGVTIRPSIKTDEHIYNLRNQTWGPPRKVIGDERPRDPIAIMRGVDLFPSNSDVVTYSLYPDAGDEDDRLTDRFNVTDVVNNPIGTSAAPKGFFIIDALSRGTSRLEEYLKLRQQYSELGYSVSNLPKDNTPGGPTIVAEYAGRVFYAGFSGEVDEGDENSPKMSSYILFSKLVEDTTDLKVCYQTGDPTSKEEPDLVDTDGGFIRIDGAYGITGLVNVNNSLMVIAANGVWLVQGGSDYGFKATNYVVSKVTNYGCTSPGSITQVDTSVMYWAEDGIYVVAQNQFGDYVADNITQKTIQSYYEDIESLDRSSCRGVYDSYERKVYWTFNNRIASDGASKQLIFDVTLGAFYPFEVGVDKFPLLATGVKIPPYRIVDVFEEVTVQGELVEVEFDDVFIRTQMEQSAPNETAYLAILSVSPVVTFSFCFFTDEEFIDWKSFDGVGVDAKAQLLTGWMSGGDFQRYKQTPYLTMHFSKTEDGFVEDDDGDWVATNQSSCLVSSQWDWSNHINSGQWGTPFQAYRFRRHYIPTSIDDTFDNGYQTVNTRNKLRGKGKVLSLLMETEPKKDCRILGWSMVMSSNGSV